jgi:hypothetical protein
MLTGDVSYVPGARTAVTGDQCLVLVEAPADSPAVGRIWQRLGQGATAGELLAALVADGLGGTPGFALLATAADGQPRLFCRGPVGQDAAGPGTTGPDAVLANAVLAETVADPRGTARHTAAAGVWQLVAAARHAATASLPLRRRAWVAVNPVSLWASPAPATGFSLRHIASLVYHVRHERSTPRPLARARRAAHS